MENKRERAAVPSAVPFFSLGIFAIFYSLIFPLYLWWHYLIPIALGAGLFFLVSRLCRPKFETVEAVFGRVRKVSSAKALKYSKIFLCVIIVFSIVFGGVRSMNTYRDTVLKAYEEGEAGRAAIRITESASNLSVVAERYIAGHESLKALKTAIGESKRLQEAGAVDKNAVAVVSAVSDVRKALADKILTEKDSADLSKFFAQIKADCRILSGDEYNGKAKTYNETLGTYPAKLFADMTGANEFFVFSEKDINTEEK